MGEHQIDFIVWYEKRHRVVVSYGDGKPDRIVANERLATLLAKDAGLVLVASRPGVVRWAREPDSDVLLRGQGRRVDSTACQVARKGV
jgi:hypothetical protein